MVRRVADTWSRIATRISIPADPDGCWIWTGELNRKGYGIVSVKIGDRWKRCSTHRLVYQRHTGVELTPDVMLLHSCDNPPCCNPAHLRPGTHLENMHDRKTRGAGYARGTDCHNAADVSDEVVAAIRAEYRHRVRGRGTPALAAKYGLSRHVVCDILDRVGRWAEEVEEAAA